MLPDWDLSGAREDLKVFFAVGYRVAQADKYPEWKPGNEFSAKREAMLKKRRCSRMERRGVGKVPMTGDEIVALSKKHTLFEWSAQAKVDPIPVARAKGIYFWTPEGKRFIDFNSQLMCVNIGHGDERVIRAIQEQAATLAYANPFMATEPRARLGQKLAEICPGDIDVFFFTNGGAEANENAIKLARWATGRHKILARYRSYHGATAGSITLTGDPRRWAASRAFPASCTCSIRTTASSAAGIRPRSRWRCSKRSSSSRARRPSRRSSSNP